MSDSGKDGLSLPWCCLFTSEPSFSRLQPLFRRTDGCEFSGNQQLSAPPVLAVLGHTGSPGGVDPSQQQPNYHEPRQGGPRLPELDEEKAEGVGEPSTIERPRMRARFVDQGDGWPDLPGSRGGAARRPNAAALARRGVGHGIAVGGVNEIRQRRQDGDGAAAAKKAIGGQRAPQPSRDQRTKANRKEDRGPRGGRSPFGMGV